MTNIPGNNTVIVDSDALIGLINETDKLHERCLEVSRFLSLNNCGTVVPYSIVLEAATTLSRSTVARPDLAAQLLQDYAHIEDEPTYDSDVSGLVAKLYNPQTSKKNTPFDHYILAIAKKNNIKYIFSFDSFYKKNGLTLVEDLVKNTNENN